MGRALVIGLLIGVTALTGCVGNNCQSACRRVYGPSESEGECDIRTPGVEDWTEMYDSCLGECEFAMRQTGDLGGYDPYDRNVTGEAITLNNERQAAAWIDCVMSQNCERLDEGYCAPI